MTAALSSDRSDARSSGEWPVEATSADRLTIKTAAANTKAAPVRERESPDIPTAIANVRRRKVMGRALRWTLVGVNLVLGIAGLVLPGLQGILHLVIGAALLAPDIPAARRLTLRLFRKWPWVRRRLPRAIRDLTRRDRSAHEAMESADGPGEPPSCG